MLLANHRHFGNAAKADYVTQSTALASFGKSAREAIDEAEEFGGAVNMASTLGMAMGLWDGGGLYDAYGSYFWLISARSA